MVERAAPRTIRLREWTRLTPDEPLRGAALRGLELTRRDRALLATLSERTSLRVEERRDGLSVEVGPHVGAVRLSGVQLLIEPKLSLRQLTRMVAYALRLSDLTLGEGLAATLEPLAGGLVDVMGVSLLRAVERVARGGLLPEYVERAQALTTPRGRIDLGDAALRRQPGKLRCVHAEFTLDHALNQALVTGLRHAAGVVEDRALALALRRAADRLLPDITPAPLDARGVARLLTRLDRRATRYRGALELIGVLLSAGRGVGLAAGAVPVSAFLLDMNLMFERFVTRHLREHAPERLEVLGQQSRSGVFTYLENPDGWRHPSVRPDLVVREGDEVVFIADAKYRDRHTHPPTAAELYQLTTYGLAFPMRTPRRVVILHPLATGERDRPAEIRFAPDPRVAPVHIHLIGVPLDAILDGTLPSLWTRLEGVAAG